MDSLERSDVKVYLVLHSQIFAEFKWKPWKLKVKAGHDYEVEKELSIDPNLDCAHIVKQVRFVWTKSKISSC